MRSRFLKCARRRSPDLAAAAKSDPRSADNLELVSASFPRSRQSKQQTAPWAGEVGRPAPSAPDLRCRTGGWREDPAEEQDRSGLILIVSQFK